MKTLILIASMFFACLQGAKSQGSPPQRFVPPVNSVPIFLDSAKLKMDIRKLDILKEIYMKLERKKIGMVYSYGFEIDTNGKADLKWPDKNPRLMKINPFVEEMLKTY
ncbi:MAG TPA: hypothetical protein VKB19_17770, partial [Pedobacter sp.]|nr:hypothetical protein [Pedobacter sp.]